MNVLVTGGAGYIGSHTVLELLQQNDQVVVIDNLSNSSRESLHRVEEITGKKVAFYEADLLDKETISGIFGSHQIDAVIHFAGYKAVGESVEKPLEYYQNNMLSTMVLYDVMQMHGVQKIVFSSSATVYGDPHTVPIREDFPLSATNPYGRTKLFIEYMLSDFARANSSLCVSLLRYFNPVGAHISGRIGEDPNGKPNNLMPFISQVAVGKRDKLSVFGGDYPTPDGTGIRDYIHVEDLAKGHLAALRNLNEPGVHIHNLGTGTGRSVLEMIHAFEAATGVSVPYEITDRRPGDIASCYADPALAEKELKWKAEKTIEEMCADTWRWQRQNPDGFRS